MSFRTIRMRELEVEWAAAVGQGNRNRVVDALVHVAPIAAAPQAWREEVHVPVEQD